MHIEILTPDGSLFEGEAREVSLTTAAGRIGILPHHEPMTAIVVPGTINLQPSSGSPREFISGPGLVEVAGGQVRLLTEPGAAAAVPTAKLLAEAIQRAESLAKNTADKTQLASSATATPRNGSRLGIANLRRHHRKSSPPADTQ